MEIVEFAKAWLDIDPDPETKQELEELLKSGESAKLEELFGSQLAFGTAGLRAELGPGPQRMNRVMVQTVTRAFFNTVKEQSDKARAEDKHKSKKPAGIKKPATQTKIKIAIGYDGRKNSDIFARDSAQLVSELGGEALLIDAPLPTPVLAHSVLKQSAEAGIMITASHNPRQDNGYKAYWSDGAQIASPYDRLVEQNFSKMLKGYSSLSIEDYPEGAAKSQDLQNKSQELQDISQQAVADYVDCLAAHLQPKASPPKGLKLVYTPLHGVGKDVLEKVFKQLGLPQPLVVSQQAEPDGSFPTVSYPNPEEPGALDLALALAKENNADLLLANDPDADRLAVGLPANSESAANSESGGWRVLTGNETGVLLADYCMQKADKDKQADKDKKLLVATTCVSSQLLGKMAKARDIEYVETLTGFKWIARADARKKAEKDTQKDVKFIFGYEEALGYSVLPVQVRDKDGISAAAAFVNLYSMLAEQNKTPFDRLDELSEEFGLHLTSAASIRYEGTDAKQSAKAMARLRAGLPTHIGDRAVADVLDYGEGAMQRPANMVSFYLEDQSRIVVRPSGTEPKLKVYVELVEKDMSKRVQAQDNLAALTSAAARLVAEGAS